MPKSLDQAIGCWTTNPDALQGRLKLLSLSVRASKRITERNQDPRKLYEELKIMLRRIDSFKEIAASAQARCKEIIETGECK
jgi:hypothetical protein